MNTNQDKWAGNEIDLLRWGIKSTLTEKLEWLERQRAFHTRVLTIEEIEKNYWKKRRENEAARAAASGSFEPDTQSQRG